MNNNARLKQNLRVLLIVSGGIAIVKSLELLRAMRVNDWEVQVMMSEAAKQFISPLTFATLSGRKVVEDMFDADAPLGHINYTRDKDLIVIAPATANLLVKYSIGLADDFISTTLLASNIPVMIAPAMNPVMWAAEPIQNAVEVLINRSVKIIPPGVGDTACGEEGSGRMSEPVTIMDEINKYCASMPFLSAKKFNTQEIDETMISRETCGDNKQDPNRNSNIADLSGKKIIITTGATREWIDPVRFISNHSSGKQGHALAQSAVASGADVILIRTPDAPDAPLGCKSIEVNSAREMLSACQDNLPADVFISVAAVADWRVASELNHKIKRNDATELSLKLVVNPDILASICASERRPKLTIGFAAETENVISNAKTKRNRKNCDWIVANCVSGEESAFGSDYNSVTIISSNETNTLPKMSKSLVSQHIINAIADEFAE